MYRHMYRYVHKRIYVYTYTCVRIHLCIEGGTHAKGKADKRPKGVKRLYQAENGRRARRSAGRFLHPVNL